MSREEKFWEWFLKNREKYYSVSQMEDLRLKEKLLNEFLDQLHEYSDKLYFEIGRMPDDTQELIITAEGDANYFGEVEDLVAHAPKIPNWKIIAFKQPADSIFVTQYEGLELNPSSMWFMPLDKKSDPTSFGLRVCLENYTERHRDLFLAGVYKVLDTLIGEKSSGADIKYLDVGKCPEDPESKGLIELVELPAYMSWRKK